MTIEFIHQQNIWLTLFILIITFIIVNISFFYLGLKYSTNTSEDAKTEISNIQIAFFGLLALLLAFSFTMSETRYDVRKQIRLEQANAIDNAYLRTQLLPL